MSLTIIYDLFDGNGTLGGPFGPYTDSDPAIASRWRTGGFEYFAGCPIPPTVQVSGGAFVRSFASGAQGVTPAIMGKIMNTSDYLSRLAGNATNDKVAEIETSLVWRQQSDQFTYTSSGATTTVPNHSTFLGLVLAGTLLGVAGYAVLVTRTGGASPSTTGRLVKIDTTSSFASPTFSDIGGAAVTLPNATNGERWTLKARVTWFAPTFTLASITATFIDATGTNHVIGLPSGQNSATFGTNTGQGALATWSAGQLYVGFINRPGWRVIQPNISTSVLPGGFTVLVAPNQFERLRVRDVGPLANLTTSTPAYTFAPSVTYSAASVSTETNASAYSLTVQPSFSQETVDQWAVADFYSDSGDRVAFPLQTKRRRRWSFRWTALDDSEKATLATLNANVKGRFSTWSWTDPETAVAVNVRFTSDIEFQKIGPTAWSAAANVEEVL